MGCVSFREGRWLNHQLENNHFLRGNFSKQRRSRLMLFPGGEDTFLQDSEGSFLCLLFGSLCFYTRYLGGGFKQFVFLCSTPTWGR